MIEAVEAVEKLKTLARNQESPVLYTLSSVFPFDFFPTQISIEKTKINLIRHIFFGAEEIESILITQLSDVEIFTSVFFAAMRITHRLPTMAPKSIQYLKVQEALKARRIIQGLMTGLSAHVDLSQVPTDELKKRIESLGVARATM